MARSKETPNCYDCKFRGTIPGDAHTRCLNEKAHVTGDAYGKRSGWFFWPFNFDPTWLETCDGFEAKVKAEAKEG